MSTPRERLFNLPGVLVWLIVAMGAIHAFRLHFLTNEDDLALLATFAFVPARLTAQFDAAGVAAALRNLALRGGDDIEIASFFFGDGQPQPWSVLTYGLLHADWTHFGLNAIWFAAFGAPVARRFGAWRFLALCIVTALAGTGVHWLFHLYDAMPMIGASAAVSGAMGAALRFVFQPGAPLGLALALRPDEPLAYRLPALPLRHVMRDQRVLTFIIFWFASNLIFGVGAQPLGLSEAGIAWQAHVGGFLAGLLFFSAFDPKRSDFTFELR